MFKFLKKTETKPEEQNNQPTPTEESQKEERTDGKIAYDDFTKVEMTVGEIIEAEKVENADRLLKLKVDFGSEQRQIVSGIAEHFSPEDLIGRKSPFVTNLEPRKIRGEESNGMILAAKDADGNFSLLSVDDKIAKGTQLS
jgi:methionyl-tRNA synthetase